jgi:DTW domain-containing protein YfiP
MMIGSDCGTSARPVCRGCGRALVAWVPARGEASAPRVAVAGSCFCDRITVLPTRTRILLLQHPRERRVAIGTARMAQLALPSSRLRVGLDFTDDPEVQAVLARPESAYVLFPGPGAVPVETLQREGGVTLVVLDGTWWQARKLLKLNPAIAALPRVAFVPRQPSAYVIRREPAAYCVSTIEALAHVLNAIEPEGGRFSRLLDPFLAMVERQSWFRAEVRAKRHRFVRRRAVSPREALAARLQSCWTRLVCVHGEANAWPRHHPRREPPETIHWVAHRPATAETFEAVLAPRRSLAKDTPAHVELSPEHLRSGCSPRQWHDAWSSFTTPDDILVMWGTYYRDIAAADGLPLSVPSMNLRDEVTRLLRRRFGTVEASMEPLGATPAPLTLPGRGGRRLAALVGALESLRLPAALLAFVTVLAASASSAGAQPPSLERPDPARGLIGISVTVTVPAKTRSFPADAVFFARVYDDADRVDADHVVRSTTVAQGRAYLVNVVPGRYVAVGCTFDPEPPDDAGEPRTPDSPGEGVVVFSEADIAKTEVDVPAAAVAFMGRVDVQCSSKIKESDAAQAHYLPMIAPKGAKQGFLARAFNGHLIYTGAFTRIDRDAPADARFWSDTLGTSFKNDAAWTARVSQRPAAAAGVVAGTAPPGGPLPVEAFLSRVCVDVNTAKARASGRPDEAKSIAAGACRAAMADWDAKGCRDDAGRDPCKRRLASWDAQLKASGSSLLFAAAQAGEASICATLLAMGSDPNAPISTGATPKSIATERGYAEIVALFSETAAPPPAPAP